MSRSTPLAPFVAGQTLSARQLNTLRDAVDSVRQIRGGPDATVAQSSQGISFDIPAATPPRAYPGVVARVTGPAGLGGGIYSGRVATLAAQLAVSGYGTAGVQMPQGMILPAADDALILNLPENAAAGSAIWDGAWIAGIVVGTSSDGRYLVAADRTAVEFGEVISFSACGNSVVLRPPGGASDGSADVTCRIISPAGHDVPKKNFSTGDTLAFLTTGVLTGVCMPADVGGVRFLADGTSLIDSMTDLNLVNDHGGRSDFSLVPESPGACSDETEIGIEWNGINVAAAYGDGSCEQVRTIELNPDQTTPVTGSVVPVFLRLACEAMYTAGVSGQLPVAAVQVSSGITSVTCDPASGTIQITESLQTIYVPSGTPVSAD